ncbi:MAG TPA: hypothetical protein VF070_31680 [Streptosporangiaceae bacterium]
MAGAGTGRALGDFQAFDPPLEGHPLGRTPGQRNGALVVLSGCRARTTMAWLPSYTRPGQ